MGRVKANADGSLNTNFDWDPVQGPKLAKDIAQRAHAAGKKAILMLGGDDNGAEILSAVSQHRAVFIQNLLAAMNSYGYDGLDLDWETHMDWDQMQSFAKDLRQAAPNAVLTMPIGPLNINYDVVNPHLPVIAKQLDRLNLMTYYPTTSWAGSGWLSWFSSPLKGATPGTPVSIESSLQRLADAGIAKQKLAMGVGFYATCYTGGITAPMQSTENGVTIAGGDNDYPLSELYGTGGAYNEAKRHWYGPARQPYLSLSKPERHGCLYVSHEDEASLLEKGKFSRQKGYGGTIVWTLSQGHVRSHSDPNFLVRALGRGFIDPNMAATVGLSVLQGDVWLKTQAKLQFNALVTGTDNKLVNWSVLGADCGTITADGAYVAPAQEKTCTVQASSQAQPALTAQAQVTISNAPWKPKLDVTRPGTWWVEVKAEDPSVVSMSMQWPDGTTSPLSLHYIEWNTNYPVFVANYGFPDAGGSYLFTVRSANNRSAKKTLVVPPCNHGADGMCQ